MLLQRLATGATGMKQARYRQGPTLGLLRQRSTRTRMRSIHSVSSSIRRSSALAVQCETWHCVMRVLHFRAIHCLVCVCIRLFVCSRSSCFSARLHLQPTIVAVSRRLFLDFDSWILEKYAVKSHYANELELTVSRFRALSGPTKGSNDLKDNCLVECCVRD